MKSNVKAIPDGYHAITPYLIVNDAAAAIDFYKQVFDASELLRVAQPDGKIGHAELKINGSIIMLADEHPEMNALSPKSIGGSPVIMSLYVENVDATVEQAVAAGARIMMPVADQFYGDRAGSIEDPFGHRWHIATHIEDVTPEEIHKRLEAIKNKQ